MQFLAHSTPGPPSALAQLRFDLSERNRGGFSEPQPAVPVPVCSGECARVCARTLISMAGGSSAVPCCSSSRMAPSSPWPLGVPGPKLGRLGWAPVSRAVGATSRCKGFCRVEHPCPNTHCALPPNGWDRQTEDNRPGNDVTAGIRMAESGKMLITDCAHGRGVDSVPTPPCPYRWEK